MSQAVAFLDEAARTANGTAAEDGVSGSAAGNGRGMSVRTRSRGKEERGTVAMEEASERDKSSP